jgi:hypothetical protein
MTMMVRIGYLAKVNFFNNKVMYSFFLINKNCYRLSVLSFTVLQGVVFLSKIKLGYFFNIGLTLKELEKLCMALLMWLMRIH